MYFPWRRTAVHPLAPPFFDFVRLDRNRNKITRAEQQRLRTLTVTVVGLSVGHVISHCIALEGLCGRLRLADFDTIDLSNVNRIPATVLDLGRNKAIVTARRIAELDPYLPIDVETSGATAENIEALLRALTCWSRSATAWRSRFGCVRWPVNWAFPSSWRPPIEACSTSSGSISNRTTLLYGLLDVTPEEVQDLSAEEKVPHVMRVLDPALLSSRMAASLVEMDRTLVIRVIHLLGQWLGNPSRAQVRR